MKKIALILSILGGLLLVGGIAARERVAQFVYQAGAPEIPPAQDASDFVPEENSAPANTDTVTKPKPPEAAVAAANPARVNLRVPFTVQAPHANWEQPYQDACEEASAAMVHAYYAKTSFPNANQADAELKKIFAWEDANFGYNKDTDAEQTAETLRKLYGYKKVVVRYDVTAEDIRNELRAGRPVIIPVYGKGLKNPYFRNGGPVYHMLVIKGYIDNASFITNDPGTRRGADFVYGVNTVMNAMHDWNGGNVLKGRKAMVVVYPN